MVSPGDGLGEDFGRGGAVDAALEELAELERRAGPAPSDKLVARVLADAATVASERAVAPVTTAEAPPPGAFGRLLGRLLAGPQVAAVALAAVFALATGLGYMDTPETVLSPSAADEGGVAAILAELALTDLSRDAFF